ncbi:MAG: transcriptional repressor LexA [Planctomycetota bacterium]
MDLTRKQLDILRYVRDYRTRHGCSPTLREMGEAFGVSKGTLHEHVESLIKKGALTRNANKSRSLRLTSKNFLPEDEDPMRLPLVGRIAAGYPIEKVPNTEELDLEDFFGQRTSSNRGNMFALRVDGDSMRDEGIWDGDYVIVEQRATARNGELVVALLPNGESTLKTFFKEKGYIRLQPANPDFEPILVRDCTIQGVVMGVMRSYR